MSKRMLGGPHWTGKPTARRTRRMVLLECPSGHLLRAVALSDWAGSRDEMRAGDLWHCYARPTGRQR